MSNTQQFISAKTDRDILILTIMEKRVREYELAEAIGRELAAAVGQAPAKVVVDMGQVEFMSSVGYGPLLSLRSCVRESSGRLVLCNLSEVVKDMFHATRLLINPHSPKSLFEHADTIEDAVTLLSSEA